MAIISSWKKSQLQFCDLVEQFVLGKKLVAHALVTQQKLWKQFHYGRASHEPANSQVCDWLNIGGIIRFGRYIAWTWYFCEGTSWTGTFGARPSHVEDLVRSLDPTISTDQNGHAEGSEFHVIAHPCTTWWNIWYGPSLEFHSDGILQYVI